MEQSACRAPSPKLRLRAGQLGCGGGNSDDIAALIGVGMMTLKGRCNRVGDRLRARQFSNKARGGGPGSLGEALRSGGAQIQRSAVGQRRSYYYYYCTYRFPSRGFPRVSRGASGKKRNDVVKKKNLRRRRGFGGWSNKENRERQREVAKVGKEGHQQP